MSENTITAYNVKSFRQTAFAFATLLGGLASWVLGAELVRPGAAEFAADAKSAVNGEAHRDVAILAARIGLIRGDLWAEAAFTYSDGLWNQDNHSLTQGEAIKALSERAISYAPYDSRLWIILAANYFRHDWLNKKAVSALKMSYYTAPNVMALIPARLFLSIQSPDLEDSDFQELVRHDIHVAIIRKSELASAIVAAFNDAPLSGRNFIEKTLPGFDSSMSALNGLENGHR